MDKIIAVTKSAMPDFEEYVGMLRHLWDTRILTNMGEYHNRFEKELREYLTCNYVSLVCNGHMALELALQALDLPKGSEVITTPFTFISTTHAIVRNGLAPVFCDIREDDCTIDADKIEALITDKTSAILPVHVYGNICDVEKIEAIAGKYHLKVLYDGAHAFGETYKGRNIATFGDATIFSFHATKVFHTLEGGAVCSQSRKIYDKLYDLKNFGIRSEELVAEVGANAKMNEFSAAMGICNLKDIERLISDRKTVYGYYEKHLWKKGSHSMEEDTICRPWRNSDITYNYGYFPIIFKGRDGAVRRDASYEKLRTEGIFARKYFYPISTKQECYRKLYGKSNTPIAEDISRRVLALPLYGELSEEDVRKIAGLI